MTAPLRYVCRACAITLRPPDVEGVCPSCQRCADRAEGDRDVLWEWGRPYRKMLLAVERQAIQAERIRRMAG